MPALGNALGLPFRKNGLGFVGALDAYLTNLIAVYSINDKLVASYNGSAVRVRRSSDNTLTDIGFLGNGDFDAASYLAFIGAGNGFAHTIYDQSGNGRHQVQATAAAQAQIGVDGNGHYYLYAPGAGFSTTNYYVSGLSLSITDFTLWSVCSAAAYAFGVINLRDAGAPKERVLANYSSSLLPTFQDNATGTVATIGSTNTNVYSAIWAAGSGGNKIGNRLTTATGTRVPSSLNISNLGLGRSGGGAFWAQNSRFYLGAAWSEDKGPKADFAALATLGQTLITAAQ